MQYARDMAKAEKELEIELWVIISFYRTTEQGGKVLLPLEDDEVDRAEVEVW